MDREELEKLKKDSILLNQLQQTAMIGWWSINFSKQEYECADLLRDICGMPSNHLSFEEFRAKIYPDHFERVMKSALLFIDTGLYEEKFLLQTKFGYRWVNSKLGSRELMPNGDVVATGYLRFLDNMEVELLTASKAEEQIKVTLEKYTNITKSMMHLLGDGGDSDVAITETLTDILTQFKGSRVSIFKYNRELRTQDCVYEVISDNVEPQIEMLKSLSMDATPWWTNQLIEMKNPITLNSLDELPPECREEREILLPQKINSLIIVPLLTNNETWGYLGIDIVDGFRIWSSYDKLWLLSVSNIIILSIQFHRAVVKANAEKRRFSDLYENMPMGFVRMTLLYNAKGEAVDYLTTEMNRAAEVITGCSRELVIGRTAGEMDELSEARIKFLNEIIHNGIVDRKADYFTKGGRYYNYTAYRNEENEAIVIFNDSTDNIVAHRDLMMNKNKLDKIYKNIPLGIELYGKDGLLVEVNDADLEIFGSNRELLIGSVNIFENPNVPKELLDDLKRGNGIDMSMEYDFSLVRDFEFYPTREKNMKYLTVKGVVLHDVLGDIENYLFVIIDQTETVKSNRKLQDFEVIFDSISDFSKIGLCRWNVSEKRFMATGQWYNNVCHNKVEHISIMDAYTNINIEDKKDVLNDFDEIINLKKNSFGREVRVYDDNGTEKWLRCYFKRSNNDSRNFELIGLNIDITEIKNAELKLLEAKTRAEESDRLKSAFVANMSHEIRTPLNAIVGFSDMLVDSTDSDERREYMTIIKQNNELLLQLISDILDLSKIESGIITLHNEEVDAYALCSDIVRSNSIKTSKNVELIFDTIDCECEIVVDRNKLTQVIANLVSNAIKFTKEGSIRVGYEIKGEELLFHVKDTGIGIEESAIATIFDRFVKLNTFIQGSGLGLSICKSLIDKMDGKIWVESKRGVGSCFWISLPYTKINNSQINRCMNVDEVCLSSLMQEDSKKYTILVAEDTDSNYMLVSAILKNNYNLVRAEDGNEAIELYEKIKPDLILMDMRMPNLDGKEATLKIREKDKTIPIIALTAFAFDQDKTKALEIGCDEYLSKPISASVLRGLIKKCLKEE